MRRLTPLRIAMLLAGLYLARPSAAVEPLAVVTHEQAALQHLSRDEAMRVFLKQQPLPTAARNLIPFDRTDDSLRAQFYQSVAGMSPHRLRAYWAKRVFTGRGRPPESLDANQAAVILSHNPAAITYTPRDQPLANSKTVLSIE
ncbi:MAG: hypothetical protein HZB57_02570 [Gammaproteobacteria bacterium]|nr:hypothetical protein [Gammaproteobacteria bacterium]